MRLVSTDPRIDGLLNGAVAQLYRRSLAPTPAADTIGGMVIVDDPKLIDTVAKDHGLFRKNFGFVSAMGTSRFNANDADWPTRRDLTQPAYNEAAKPHKLAFVRNAFAKRLNAVDRPSFEAVARAFYLATLEVFFAALGSEVDVDRMLPHFDAGRAIMQRLQYLTWAGDPVERQRARDDVQDFLRGLGQIAASEPGLAAVLRHIEEKAGGAPNFSALEEFAMSFLAGNETAVSTMLWVIDRLAEHPAVQDALFDELSGETDKLPALEWFINETMRSYPAIPLVIRETARETILGERRVPAGTVLLVSVVGVHHNRSFWDAPEQFRPARKEFVEETYDRRAFIPFLVGPRVCGGARLARVEIREAIRIFIQLFRAERRSRALPFSFAIAFRPESWDLVRVERRGAGIPA